MIEKSASGMSIPSRYTTEVVLNTLAKKGFQSKAARFHQDINDSPGPGAYSAFNKSSVIRETPSIGAKGTGSFASKSKRIPQKFPKSAPAPSSYNVKQDFSERKDFSRVGSSGFAQSVAQNPARRRRTRHPAPNQYNTQKVFDKMTNVSACQSAFKSSSVRDANPGPVGSNISPTKYEPTLPKSDKSVTCFKSTSSRLQPIVNSEGPGPAHYKMANVEQVPKKEELFGSQPRKHGLLISAAAMAMPPEPPTPGPGAYNISKFKNEKKFTSSAVFKSGTSRLQKPHRNFHPGPGEYNPVLPKKTSYNFLLNSNPKWIGV